MKKDKRLLSFLLTMFIVIQLLPVFPASAAETVSIGTAEELFAFAARVNAAGGAEASLDAVLTADIEVTAAWTPMGPSASPYAGTFDGGGHTINFTYDGDMTPPAGTARYGLFGTLKGTVRNLTIAGTLRANGSMVAGIAGFTDTGAASVIENCVNTANITGTTGNVAGIAGINWGRISNCGNTGAITATSGAAGGIAATASNNVKVRIENCFNRGNVSSGSTMTATGVGGIIGSNNGPNPVENCYNTGNITGYVTTNGSNGVGGIIGYSSAAISIRNAYTTGTVDNTHSAKNNYGYVIGKENVTGNSYANVYYLNPLSDSTAAIGRTTGTSTGAPERKTPEALKGSDVLTALGGTFAPDTDINDGYPVFQWELDRAGQNGDPLAGELSITGGLYVGGELRAAYTGEETVSYQWYRGNMPIDGANSAAYTVAEADIGLAVKVIVSAEGYANKPAVAGTVPGYVVFSLTPSNATAEVRDSSQSVKDPVAGNPLKYILPRGDYTYTVSAEGEYSDKTGGFTVSGANQNISVSLDDKTYAITFQTTPSGAGLTVKKGGTERQAESDGRTYHLTKGEDYTYSVDAFGYEPKNDVPFSVDSAKTISVAMTEKTRYSVTFNISGPGENAFGVVVRSTEYDVAVSPEADGGYSLPNGNYTYTVSAAGYKTAKGGFGISGEGRTIGLALEVQTAWDGETYTQPSTDTDGAYLIGTAAELMWFGKNAAMTYSARLTADIAINENMSADPNELYKWTPIGGSSASAGYAGTFDGGGHAISGLSIDGTGITAGVGLFRYINGGTVKNLTAAGRISAPNSNQVGGIVGNFNGSNSLIENCISDMAVTGKDDVGGIVGRLDGNADKTVRSCVNLGPVNGGANVGGLVGYFYYRGELKDSYNTGVVSGITSSGSGAGGLAGYINDSNAKITNCYTTGAVTGSGTNVRAGVGLRGSGNSAGTVNNCYALEGPVADTSVTFKEAAYMKSPSFVIDLGESFIMDMAANINGGYPILKFQDTRPKYTVTLTVSPADATVLLLDGDNIGARGAASDAEGVKVYTYMLPSGSYTYVVSAFGKVEKRGPITVLNGDASETVTLENAPSAAVSFNITPAEAAAVARITVKYGDTTVRQESDGSYLLPAGDYSYTVRANGYAKKTDSVTVSEAMTISVAMTASPAWDGSTVSEPEGKGTQASPYRIVYGEELAWLAQQVNANNAAAKSAFATLVNDIALGDNIWTPIGTSSTTGFAGNFNGEGHAIKGLNVTGTGDYAGLFGCINGGTVKNLTVEGAVNRPAAYYAGGIAGYFTGAGSLIENCVNKANISASNSVGGIVGYIYSGTGKVIQGCANWGSVTGANTGSSPSAGGLVGYMYGPVDLSDSYNMGAVYATTSTTFRAGGLAGFMNDSNARITNCYTTGTVSGSSASVRAGVGQLSGGAVSGCYALQGLAADSNVVFKTADEMKSYAFVTLLGENFVRDMTPNINGGYPILIFQDTGTKHRIILAVSPKDAAVSLTDAEGDKIPGAASDEAGVKVYAYLLPSGSYTYAVSAFGMVAESGTIALGDDDVSKTVALQRVAAAAVRFSITPQEAAAVAQITVKSGDVTVRQESDGSYLLPAGGYSYTVKAKNYATVSGSFTVPGADSPMSLPVEMAEFYVWDGETYTEPEKDTDGAYLIGSSDELMWFGKNAGLTASARLTGDIAINGDMDAAPSELYKWTPLGLTSAAAYKGAFDGQGHTISGLYISQTAASTGLIGYLDKDGSVKNLTVDGKIVSTASYTGGIAGYATGIVENCHNKAEISGTAYVGGVAGYINREVITNTASSLLVYGMINYCSNEGRVTGSGTRVGGITGYLVTDAGYNAITYCYNSGNVTGANYVGGIVGDHYGGSVRNVYNTGTVTATALTTTGGAGGISGDLRLNLIQNAYNVGTVTMNGGSGSPGAVIGYLVAMGSGTPMAMIDNVYFLDTLGLPAIGSKENLAPNGAAVSKTDAALKALAGVLGNGFVPDSGNINGGYPILAWQAGLSPAEPERPASAPGGWDGKTARLPSVSPQSVYQIGTAEELAGFAAAVKSDPFIEGVLTADIDLNHQLWTPIGGSTPETIGAFGNFDIFLGSFDGANHTIKNLYVNTKQPGAGLFRINGGEIANLTVTGAVYGGDAVAGIAGYNFGGVIKNCHNKATVMGGMYVAGIAARHIGSGQISDCSNTAPITAAATNAAGIAAHMTGVTAIGHPTITKCFNTGMVISGGGYTGGVCADNNSGATVAISSCYNTGFILCRAQTIYSNTGGVLGYQRSNPVENLYNTGAVVSAGSCVGGVVGFHVNGTVIRNVYNVGEVSGEAQRDSSDVLQSFIGGVAGRYQTTGITNAYYLDTIQWSTGGTAKIEAEMKDAPFATTLGSAFGADNDGLNGGYPVLTWQTYANTPDAREPITGEVEITGGLQAGDTMAAVYTDGNAKNPVYVWYTTDEQGREHVLVTGSQVYTASASDAGKTLYVKVLDSELGGVITARSQSPVGGLGGTLTLTVSGAGGLPIVERLLTAAYSIEADEPAYQWYRGATLIEGANTAEYVIQPADAGEILKVVVTGNKAGSIEKATSRPTASLEDAGVWPMARVEKPPLQDGVYLLGNEKQLLWFASEVNGGNTAINAKLSADITLTQDHWYPIGRKYTTYWWTAQQQFELPYAGTFDGGGKTIAGLMITAGGKDEQGLFGSIGDAYSYGTVKNLNVSGTVTVTGNSFDIGGVVGYNAGRIVSCSFKGMVTGGSGVGGIAGSTPEGRITDSYNEGAITGASKVGGITGYLSKGIITGCSNKGTVTGAGEHTGGITGGATNYAEITACYNTGTVQGAAYVGGIAGVVEVGSSHSGCYDVGPVSGTSSAGPVVGNGSSGGYHLDTLTSNSLSTARSEAEMKASAFLTTLNSITNQYYAADTKGINNGYPILKWEVSGSGGEDEEVDKTELRAVIAAAEALTAEDYTSETWTALQSALIFAQSVATDEGAAQVRVNNALSALQAAIRALVKSDADGLTVKFALIGKAAATVQADAEIWIDEFDVEGVPVGSTVKYVTDMVLQNRGYTVETKDQGAYIEAITNPEGIRLADRTTGINSGWMFRYNGRIGDLLYAEQIVSNNSTIEWFYTDDYTKEDWDGNHVGKGALNAAIATAETKNQADYTAESWAPFASALNAARAVAVNAAATQGEVDSATFALTGAMDGLVLKPGVVNKDALNAAIATAETKNQADYTAESWAPFASALGAAKTVAAKSDAIQGEVNTATANLTTAMAGLVLKSVLDPDKYEAAKTGVLQYVYSGTATPAVGSTFGEWAVLGLARGGFLNDTHNAWKQTYLSALKAYINDEAFDKTPGRVILDKDLYTDNSRVILALTALGFDASYWEGYNLVSALTDAEKVNAQGVNGTIFALIALDSHDYLSDNAALRKDYIDQIISKQSFASNKAWSSDGSNPDYSMTAMAVQALAPYYGKVEGVEDSVDKALDWLYANYSRLVDSSSESISQLIVALTALGIDPTADTHFIKNSRNPLDELLDYRFGTTWGFKHDISSAVANTMATEQAAYALVAYSRFAANSNSLYDMNDVPLYRPTVDKTPLTNAILAVGRLTQSDYTAASWADLQSALSAVQDVVDDDDATQEQVDGATGALLAVIKNLVLDTPATVVDKSALIGAISLAAALTESDYTAESWAALQSALSAAHDVADDDDAAQADVDSAATALLAAVGALELEDDTAVSKAVLNLYISQTESLTESDYTAASWADLQSALSAAHEVAEDDGATQADIDGTAAALFAAIGSLERNIVIPPVNKAILNLYISQTESLTESDYTAASWADLQSALSAAHDVTEDDDATQAGIDGAAAALLAAIGRLVRIGDAPITVDKAALNAAIAEAESKVQSNYTPISWGTMQIELENAKKVFADPAATQTAVNTAASNLRRAIANLQPTGSGPVNPSSMTVIFSLYGALEHTGDPKYIYRTNPGIFEKWVVNESYTFDASSVTVYDVFVRAVKAHGFEAEYKSAGNYVASIKGPNGWIGEFTNGELSGWMYTVGGTHQSLGLSEMRVTDGAHIVWHYTDDYTKEEGSENWKPAPGNSGDAANGDVNTVIDVTPTISGGKATATVSDRQVSDALNRTLEALKNNGADAVGEIRVKIGSRNAATVSTTLTSHALKAIANEKNILLTVETSVATLTFDSAALDRITSGISDGVNVEITVSNLTAEGLSDANKAIVGDSPVFELTVRVNGSPITDFGGGRVTAVIPYTPKAGEDTSKLTVYRLAGDGTMKEMTGAKYDKTLGGFVFTANHFSVFFIAAIADESDWTNPFTDVNESDWLYDAVRYASVNSLMSGTSANTFSPASPMTRAMLVTVLYRYEGEPSVTAANPFSDVAPGQWYANAAIWASSNGVVDGYGGGLFGANDEITREQIAVILWRYTEKKSLDMGKSTELASYTDAAQISSWAQDAMKWANAEGLITGRSTATLAPKGTATRAEIATILMRYIENFAEK